MKSTKRLLPAILMVFTACSLFEKDEDKEDRVWQILNEDGDAIQEYVYKEDTVTRTFFFSPGQLFPQYRTDYFMDGNRITVSVITTKIPYKATSVLWISIIIMRTTA